MPAIDVTDATFAAQIEQAPGLAIVEFWAPWSHYCSQNAPVLDKIAGTYPQVRVGKLNVDQNKQTAARFNATAVPVTLVFKGGKPVATIQGVVSVDQLAQTIQQFN